MQFPNKTFLISDPLHGSIQISEIEKKIISTELFNRLHHILQNSTVYLTYPSNRTSRFLHSIGVMHLGGEMYKYGITNGVIDCEGKIVQKFLEELYKYIDSLEKDQFFNDEIKKLGISDYRNTFEDIIGTSWNEPFYTANIPNSIRDQKLIYSFVVSLQAIRCVSLLHDLGHPPFSHMTEKALENIYKKISSKVSEKQSITEREQYFFNVMKKYIADDKLHERIGKYLTEKIFDKIIVAEPSSDKKIFYLHVKYITNAILLEKDFVGNGKIFKALHGIVDGEIDCDRLDYVSRDAMASGIFSGSIEYERLYKSMKLLETEQGFLFCPSSHILGTIEDFFNRRWRMYKNIIFHHRVAKTDTLLREVIELLAERYLSEDSKEVKINGFKIPDDISGLWKTLDSELLEGSEDDALFCIIQWDDAWLLACLRNEYFKISTSSDDSNFEILSRLEELLSNRKKYASLFKRFDGFAELDSVISKEINYELLEQNNDDKVSLLKLKERLEFINRIYNENKKPAQLCTYEIFEYFKKRKQQNNLTLLLKMH